TSCDLSQDHSSDKKFRGSPNEFDSTGLVQRCVIIQRDDNGFGLTVSGDNPVFVQLVKEDGAAMRAGVQRAGSYVALTVLGRPPGSPQMPLPEGEGDAERLAPPHGTSLDRTTVPKRVSTTLEEGQSQRESLLHSPRVTPRNTPRNSFNSVEGEDTPDAVSQTGTGSPCLSSAPQIIGAEDDYFDTEQEQINGQCSRFHSVELLKSRPAHLAVFLHHVVSQFDPAPLVAAMPTPRDSVPYNRILLCYLYADLYKQTNSKETRRIFMEMHTFFMDRGANLKVPVPESISFELDRRRPELIPEELHRQYVQLLQDSLLPEVQRQLDDFRQKRSMGLTLAEGELGRLGVEQDREQSRATLDQERIFAENVVSKIEEVLSTALLSDQDSSILDDCGGRALSSVLPPSTTLQYVLFTYMKHLGLRVKEPRGLEPKRARITFLPKIKETLPAFLPPIMTPPRALLSQKRAEKEAEEKVKKPRFPNILGGPPRKPGRIDVPSGGRTTDPNKPRPLKQLSQSTLTVPEAPELLQPARLRGSQSSEAAELPYSPTFPTSSSTSEGGGRDSDSSESFTTVCFVSLSLCQALWKGSEGLAPGDSLDNVANSPSVHFSFNPNNLDQLHEDDQECDRMDTLGPSEVMSEDDQSCEVDSEQDPPNWQQVVGRELLAALSPHEIKRQEVINELFYTERAHLRMLKVMDSVFYQRLTRDGILPPTDIRSIFANLEEIIQLHGTGHHKASLAPWPPSINEQMMAIRKKNETSVIDCIGEDLSSLVRPGSRPSARMWLRKAHFWWGGRREDEASSGRPRVTQTDTVQHHCTKTNGEYSEAEAESNRLCRRLQLKDIIPAEMQRLTKYPLLLENIAKYTEDAEEREKVRRAGECCRHVLNHVNQVVKESENKQVAVTATALQALRLEDYQRRLDLSSLKQNENPMISELKNLDLTKRKMVHEGPLSWKVNKDKIIELYTLLLEDILVLLQKQDDRLVLRCHSKNLAGSADTRQTFSPVIKLSTVLVRSVATGGLPRTPCVDWTSFFPLLLQTLTFMHIKSFFVLSMSDNGAQIYELMAQSVSEQKVEVRDAADVIRSGKLNPDRISTGNMQSSERDADALPVPGPNHFEGVRSDEGLDDDGRQFLEPNLPDRLAFHQPRSRQGVARVDYDMEAFELFPSRAEEALKSLAALRQLLMLHLSRESGFLVLEGFGDPGESSTDDESLLDQKELRDPAGSSDADPEKLLSSVMAPSMSSDLIQQDVETKYVALSQRTAGRATDMAESKAERFKFHSLI
ncbi:hypothetical protein Z043_104066, partial [Scleropages formosus]